MRIRRVIVSPRINHQNDLNYNYFNQFDRLCCEDIYLYVRNIKNAGHSLCDSTLIHIKYCSKLEDNPFEICC